MEAKRIYAEAQDFINNVTNTTPAERVQSQAAERRRKQMAKKREKDAKKALAGEQSREGEKK